MISIFSGPIRRLLGQHWGNLATPGPRNAMHGPIPGQEGDQTNQYRVPVTMHVRFQQSFTGQSCRIEGSKWIPKPRLVHLGVEAIWSPAVAIACLDDFFGRIPASRRAHSPFPHSVERGRLWLELRFRESCGVLIEFKYGRPSRVTSMPLVIIQTTLITQWLLLPSYRRSNPSRGCLS